jgi:release factor glutamine methyltransferase
MPTIREGYLWGREHLAASGSAEAAIEAEVLLRHVLHLDRAGLYARWMESIAAGAWEQYRRVLEVRATGRPVPYIIGEREFMGLRFTVDERVMIPRPETEVLVECARQASRTLIDERNARTLEGHGQPVVVDVGTGSGCIAVSLAYVVPQLRVIGTDISADALAVARGNGIRHGVDARIQWLQGDLLSPLPSELRGHVDVVVSNPPYVPQDQHDVLPREIRDFEPAVAVFTDGDGTTVHRRLIAAAPGWLVPAGLLVMEVGFGQAATVAEAIRQDGQYGGARVVPDYGGIPRVVVGTRRP